MSLSFLKVGAAVHDEVKKADAAQQAAFAAASGPQRFWVEKGKEARITFLDGGLVDGLLQAVSFYEHMVPRGAGKKGFDNYPCTQETEACPICEGGDTPSLVFAFTILDHREWTDKEGKLHVHQKRLFVCKRDTFKRLQLKAVKMMTETEGPTGKIPAQAVNGLIGVTFDVTRVGDKSASVGSDFDFLSYTQLGDVYEYCGYTGEKEKERGPYDYAEVIKYYAAKELRGMGFAPLHKSSVGSADTAATPLFDKKSSGASPFNMAAGASKFNPAKEL